MNDPGANNTPQTQAAYSGGPPTPPKKTARGLDGPPPRNPEKGSPDSSGNHPFRASVLYGCLLRFFAVSMLIVVWVGYFFLERTWPTPFKLWLCTILGVAAILQGIFTRGRSVRTVLAASRQAIPLVHAVGVAAIVIAEAIFFTWVAS